MKAEAANYKNLQAPDFGQLYDNEADRKKHMAYMASIAAEKHRDISEVLSVYEEVLCDLRSRARVHDYLNVFVAKKVIEQLRGH